MKLIVVRFNLQAIHGRCDKLTQFEGRYGAPFSFRLCVLLESGQGKMRTIRPLLLIAFIMTLFALTVQAVDPPQPLPTDSIQRIAFGSCAKQWQSQPIWNAVITAKPDLWLFLGDAVYADTDGKTAWLVTPEQLAGEWNRLADKPEFQKARTAFPMMATWDNHDYGSHAGGKEFPVKVESQKIFLDFFGEPTDSERRLTPGVYDAKVFGPKGQRVQVIMLDTRYFKDMYKKDPTTQDARLKAGKVGGYLPDDDPEKTLLGAEQWLWLAEQLMQPAEVRLIASSIQIIPNEKGMDEWGNFPLERQKLFDLIESTDAKGVVLLSGNVHFAELSRYDAGEYPLLELTSSGMTHTNEAYAKAANKYRVAGPTTAFNFGIIDLHWQGQSSPIISLKTIDAGGATLFHHQLKLEELQGRKYPDE